MTGEVETPLMSNVECETIEQVMQHLENALAPKVQFSENIEQMRQEAERQRISSIEAAMRLLYANVPGLRYRPDLSKS